jgi:hypothetical protein
MAMTPTITALMYAIETMKRRSLIKPSTTAIAVSRRTMAMVKDDLEITKLATYRCCGLLVVTFVASDCDGDRIDIRDLDGELLFSQSREPA